MAEKINAKNFKPYGWVIEYPKKNSTDKQKNLFRIVLRENKKLGWRIAYLVVRDKKIDRLEQHPDSFESFEPVKGRSILYVAKNKNFKGVESFILDKPIILKKGIWHGIITQSLEAEVKITENAEVSCVYREVCIGG